ncbi:MAG: hypothetical protein HC853_01295 [Anaerolineae bacterium]|nr:hypothetical protein [Anaerolineae bacterium]
MNAENLTRAFERMGARLLITDRLASSPHLSMPTQVLFTLDVAHDNRGETFVLRVPCPSCVDFGVIEVRPRERYLLLQAWEMKDDVAIATDKLWCGQADERWQVTTA